MRRIAIAAATSATLAFSAGCSSAPAPTATVTVTVTQQAPADSASPSTQPSATQSASVSGNLGLVWVSAVDPARVNQPASTQPKFDGGHGIATSIDMILYIDPAGDGDLSQGCADEIESSDTPKATHCVMVQFAMDVPSKYRADAANISPGPMLTPKGKQINKYTTTDGVPGAKHVVITEYYAGGEPGSTVRWDVGSNERGYKTLKYGIPKIDAFQPINFE